MANNSGFGIQELITNWESTSRKLMLLDLKEHTLDYFVKQFKSESWDNSSWTSLKPNTLKYKEKNYGTSRKLFNTGKLENDLINAQFTIKEGTKSELEIKVNNEYANYHNQGIGHIPKRQFMTIDGQEDPKELQEIQEEIINKWIDKLFK